MEISILLAFAAGILAFASPCFLPIVPVFVGQIVGGDDGVSRTRAGWHAVAFMAGFSAVFIAIWASVAVLGHALGQFTPILRVVGGAILIVMGLHVARLITIPVLDRLIRGDLKGPASIRNGTARSALMGLVFGAGWTPCIGPILGGILALAVQSETAVRGGLLMAVFCLGLGLPIVAVAIGAVDIHQRFDFFRRHRRGVELAAGGMLIAIGFLMITNLFTQLATLFPALV